MEEEHVAKADAEALADQEGMYVANELISCKEKGARACCAS
jgi:hypothetical protein